ncbi:copper chaperone PCu(A)C [Mesorhizobium denitrificans]|uniref:Copper chaperone PCu(A)C n=1 Tax=Mesorhizobium denitrificans TaxID=2294114 RepID=A0A371X469_9HYPH|nr:copper chaperone PCu(A)C [Mesorhizobium denitrificans]RFC63814.1 copper chaperone PCu(A)C [Mesorhizobium denitrificans]
MFKKTTAVLVAYVTLVGPASAHDFKVGVIEINHPWSRPTPPFAPVAGGYMTLKNSGPDSDRLVQVTSPIAARAEIHRSAVEDGVASMRPVDGLALEPGVTVDFEAEKLHIMFIGPKQQLQDGDKFPATLVFEKAGTVDVEFVVQRKASEPAAEDHSGHGSSN